MKTKFWVWAAMLLVLPGLMLTAACAKKAVGPSADVSQAAAKPAAPTPAAPKAGDDAAAALERQKQMERNMFLNEHVHYAFDSANLDDTAQAVLKRKADYLKKNSDLKVVVEGHCDERGTNEYNLALGERRAMASKNFLVKLGIAADRLGTISYGEERPIDPGHNEEAWAKNRRAQFIIK